MVVVSRNPIHSVLYLILTFFTLSGSLYSAECAISGGREHYRVRGGDYGTFPFCDHVPKYEAGPGGGQDQPDQNSRHDRRRDCICDPLWGLSQNCHRTI